MRSWRSLFVMVIAAGVTLLGAWLLTAWSEAGAPSLIGLTQRHPMLGTAFGLLSTLVVAASALLQRRRRKPR